MLLHPHTATALDRFAEHPGHAVLITGPEGSGKGTVANWLATKLLGIAEDSLANHPYTLWLTEQPITIENVRAAQKLMQLKVPGTATVRRIVIAEQAQTMSIEAQNAFLKLLEEPPKDTVIILTASDVQRLLPTIRSRVQQVNVLPPSSVAVIQNFAGEHSKEAVEKAYYLSEGHMGLLTAILRDDSSHPLVEQITQAKTALGGSTYERLCLVETIVKNKQVPVFLKALERICHAALVQSSLKNTPQTPAWKSRLSAVVHAEELQQRNASVKLILTDLFLSL